MVDHRMKPCRCLVVPIAVGIGGLGPVCAEPAHSARLSLYSDISERACPRSPRHEPQEHETVSRRCRTSLGYTVSIAYRGTNILVTIVDDATKKAAGLGGAIRRREGDRMARRAPGRALAPDAAILRLQTRDNAGKIGPVLAVARIGRNGLCPAVFLDARANPDANRAARVAADRIAGGFRCGRDRPAIIGPATEVTQDVLERSRTD